MPKHVLEAALQERHFASAYNVSTPPDQIVTAARGECCSMCRARRRCSAGIRTGSASTRQSKRLPYLNELVFLIGAGSGRGRSEVPLRRARRRSTTSSPRTTGGTRTTSRRATSRCYSLGPEINSRFFWFNLNKVQPPLQGETLPPGKRVGDSVVDPVKYAWFSNPVFRRAVSMAIDRDAMIRSVFFGEGYEELVHRWPAATRSGTPRISSHYDYNVAESKRLLASLGFKDGNGDGVLEDTQGQSDQLSR